LRDKDKLKKKHADGDSITPPTNYRSSRNSSSMAKEIFNKAAIEEERVWVQCNRCDKWRSLPSHVDTNSLPDIWTCSMNVTDPSRMTCSAPEEAYKQEEDYHVKLKTFFKGWTRRLRNADRAEMRLPSASVTRGRKRTKDSEWIQCCNPACRKWRALSRGIEAPMLLKRLNKKRNLSGFGGSPGIDRNVWYCRYPLNYRSYFSNTFHSFFLYVFIS
jgi:hypothetical protein